jgi:hypothetical protein
VRLAQIVLAKWAQASRRGDLINTIIYDHRAGTGFTGLFLERLGARAQLQGASPTLSQNMAANESKARAVDQPEGAALLVYAGVEEDWLEEALAHAGVWLGQAAWVSFRVGAIGAREFETGCEGRGLVASRVPLEEYHELFQDQRVAIFELRRDS